MKYIALLRGINVGGNSIMKMADLKKVVENCGFQNVGTYIQSGNVFLESDKSAPHIEKSLEDALVKKFKLNITVVVKSHEELEEILKNVPREWKNEADLRRYLAFIKSPKNPAEITKEIKLKEGIDSLKEGQGVIYMTTKLTGITQSGFSKLSSKPIYKFLTIRNYNTTQKLLGICNKPKE